MQRSMTFLTRGSLTNEQLEVLLAFTKITSKPKINALKSHLVDGNTKAHAGLLNNVKKQHVGEGVKELEKKRKLIEQWNLLALPASRNKSEPSR